MSRLILVLCLITQFGLSAFAQKVIKVEKASEHSTYVKGDNFEGVIFDKDYRSKFFPVIDSMSKRFSPTVEEVLLLEKALSSQIKELNKHRNYQTRKNAIDRHLNRYCRQYYGYIDLKGKKIIGVNSFIRDFEDNSWRWEYQLFFDGGASVWQVMFDISTDKLFSFGTNGVA